MSGRNLHRRSIGGTALALTVLVLAACGGGGITLPTALPTPSRTIALPAPTATVALPTALPTPTVEHPMVTPEPEPSPAPIPTRTVAPEPEPTTSPQPTTPPQPTMAPQPTTPAEPTPTVEPTPTMTPTASATPAPTQTASPVPSADAGVDAEDANPAAAWLPWMLPLVLLAVAIGLGAYFLVRRRPRAGASAGDGPTDAGPTA
jgi:outer membrane biosynthesis protein TonB